jgi:hypothetical protein
MGESEMAIMGEHFECSGCGCVIEAKGPATRPAKSIGPFTCQCGAAMKPKRLEQ